MAKIQGIRGMNDILPEVTPVWQFVESTTQQLLQRYGNRELRTPVLEQTQLFTRSIGAVTDIVEDTARKLVSTPAYMLAQNISEAASGINKLVDRVLELTHENDV